MKKAIIITLGIMTANISVATPLTALNAQLGQFKTLSASFTQRVTDDSNHVLQTSSGNMAIEKPGHFRWEQEKPFKQLIVVNGEAVSIYDPDLEQVTQKSLGNSTGNTPALLLGGHIQNLNKLFEVTSIPEKDGITWFKLTSRDPDAPTDMIMLGFQDSKITEMHIKDNLGHNTDIHFSAVVVNSTLSADIFAFTPPAGVDIIDDTPPANTHYHE